MAVCLAISTPLLATSPNVVISQVYGGGGNSGATFKNDFIELFNRGTSPVSLAGWSVQYASAGGTTWTNITPLSGMIAPGHYFLIQEAAGAGGTTPLPTPDVIAPSPGIAMAAGAGKVALVNSTLALTSTGCPFGASVVDFVGYGTGGTGANCFEGVAAAPTLTNTTAGLRANGGCTDSDNNASDFASGAPNPRNSSSTGTCGNNPPTITAPVNPITTVTQDAAPFTVNLTGNDDGGIYNWSATAGLGVVSVSVTGGQGTSTATFTVALQAGFNGTATFTASLSDNVNAAATQAVNIRVNAVAVNNPPTLTAPPNPIASVGQNAPPFGVSLTGNDDGAIYNWSALAGTGVGTVSVTGGQGTSTATFTVTLQTNFNGTASFTASLSDGVNPAASQLVNIAVAPPPNHIVIHQIYGGGGNASATFKNDYIQLFNPTAASINVTGWSVQYASATGSSWQTQPIGGPIGPGEYYLISLGSGGATGADLPAANIVGSINMSATTGKVALANSGAALTGICPTGSVVDFIGYGTGANCSEGNVNAPPSSNTTALFRKNGGNTDTNNNGNDFTAGTPNPFRTSPIAELGPWIANSSPADHDTTIPKDSSVSIDFSEPVDVVGTWYNISCGSGLHNDATVAHTSNFKTWVITPNVNFQFGEQCGVTIFASAVHDQDLDDSAPNTDTLFADVTWSFTVVGAGDPAPYPPSVHLTMGNPTNALADVTTPNNYLMEKPTYSLSYNRDMGRPNWVSWHLDSSWYGSLARTDRFRPDPAIPPSWYRVQDFDFTFSGFDRGHMTPNADRDNQNRIPINQETYLMTNMIAQAHDNNSGPWGGFEAYLRTLVNAGDKELYIVSGPTGVGGTGTNGFVTTLANGHVTVPSSTWKVALLLPKGDNDVTRVTASTRTIAIVIPNVTGIINNDWSQYLITVRQVETLTGYNFFSNVPQLIQNCIELGLNGVNPPCADDQSLSTNEDTAGTITLNALSPSGGPLTYTFTATPAHGTLSGTGASQTYTPAPDFNGSDSFSYKVSDATGTSNIATVNISVREVNDPPVASNDTKSTDEDTTLTFPASDLTTNDSTGPANESGQTLTVSSVAPNANTHGNVSLVSGQVTYTPDANFNGPASFTYQVCDNGVTAGLSDSRCATGTVNVTVNPVNDPPAAVGDAKNTNEDTALVFASSDLTANDAAGPANESGQSLTVTTVASNANTHGSVALAGGQITYTPEADYNGPAAFTYQVCDNGAPSLCATGTVNITVAAVNDAPVAVSDALATEAGMMLTFAAADLTTNDSTGPADESSQTLTVTAVTATTETHGTVVLDAEGHVKYTPEMFFAGEATFTYQVCDNGTPSQCSNGAVTVTVSDTTAPVMSALTLSDTRLWPPNHQMVIINVGYTVMDFGDSAPVCTLSVSSNEPDNGLGDGDTPGDSIIVNAHQVKLRAERAASGNGRIYTIGADCTDRFGNVAHKSATVTVPKDNSK
ncbi:MAG TPA: Ig-like domain-containing protein [Thermoanaerobaculia bacterium]